MRDVRVDVLAERGLARKVRDGERLLSEDAKEALDLVQPRRARRRVVEVHARILREPLLHLRRAVRRRVVEHDVQLLPRMATRDMLHEAEKILGCVTVRAPVGDLAIRNVQRCVQVDDAVTLVVVRVTSGASFAKRQRKLRTLERLNLRLLVDAQAFCGGFRYRPTTSVTFAANSGSRLTLYVRTK
jgi:hypothetical protein